MLDSSNSKNHISPTGVLHNQWLQSSFQLSESPPAPTLRSSTNLLFSLIHKGSSSREELDGKHSTKNSLKSETTKEMMKKERLILGFWHMEKLERIPNVTLLLVVIVVVNNHVILRIIINNKSSCDIMYVNLFVWLGLRKEDLHHI